MTQNTNTFHDLPTLEFKDVITDAVDRNQVVILTAETGAGKSTQVPQSLALPRILETKDMMATLSEVA
jgi:HrpA-like RNA helicase